MMAMSGNNSNTEGKGGVHPSIHSSICSPIHPLLFLLLSLSFCYALCILYYTPADLKPSSVFRTGNASLELANLFFPPDGRQPGATPAAPSRGGAGRPTGASQPRTGHQDPHHPGAEPHRGEAAAGATPHAVQSQRRPPSGTELGRLQTTGAAGQGSQSRCCRGETGRRGDVPCCPV